MEIAYWIAAGLTSVMFLMAGGTKLVSSEAALREKGMLPAGRSLAKERGIGLVEVIGVLGLILPPLLNIVPVLAPIAAVGLVITMIIAMIDHKSRNEPINGPILPGLLALVTAVLGFIVWL